MVQVVAVVVTLFEKLAEARVVVSSGSRFSTVASEEESESNAPNTSPVHFALNVLMRRRLCLGVVQCGRSANPCQTYDTRLGNVPGCPGVAFWALVCEPWG